MDGFGGVLGRFLGVFSGCLGVRFRHVAKSFPGSVSRRLRGICVLVNRGLFEDLAVGDLGFETWGSFKFNESGE